MRAEPTNEQVAKVLGISKGTVDSNFFAIKTKFDDNNAAAQQYPKEPK
jgi:hypothetical protein